MTATAQAPSPQSDFSTRLRAETNAAHRAAEGETFVTKLMGGELNARAYQALLEQYAHIYPALEAAVAKVETDPQVAAFHHPGLARTEAITRDLDALAGSDRGAPHAVPATLALVEHISSGLSVERLLAHHYLRYLGDLSGGLAIGKLVARHYGIAPEALNMWRFDGIEKPKLFKDHYRATLDANDFSPAQQQAFIEESGLGYQLNQAVFADLGREYL